MLDMHRVIRIPKLPTPTTRISATQGSATAHNAHPVTANARKLTPNAQEAANAQTRIPAVPTMPCSGCGGRNAVRDAAMARTPADLDRAIAEA